MNANANNGSSIKIIVSTAMSIDGYIDDASAQRLILSNDEDWAEVRALRAQCDGILVGAETIRKDNPSIITYCDKLKEKRRSEGKHEDPMKITVTRTGNFDPNANFFKTGTGPKLVIATADAEAENLKRITDLAKVVLLTKSEISVQDIIEVLSKEGLKSVLVEGGQNILSMFFQEDIVDEFRLAIAPIFVGDSRAIRLVKDGSYPFNKDRRMHLCSTKQLGDMSVMHFSKNKLQKDEESK